MTKTKSEWQQWNAELLNPMIEIMIEMIEIRR